MVLNKVCFSDLEVLEIENNRKKILLPESKHFMLKSKNSKLKSKILKLERLDTRSIKQMLTPEDKIDVELKDNIMTENKTTLSSLENQDCKRKLKVETIKVKKLLTNIPTRNITVTNELIDAGTKIVCNKIDVSLKHPNRNTKPGWEMKQVRYVKKKLRQQTKVLRKEKQIWICLDRKTKTKEETSLTMRLEIIKIYW